MTIPFRYQRKGVRKIEHFGYRALLADEMGLGKTFQVLLSMKRAGLRPVIVVCPASIKWTWEREAKLHMNLQALVLEGTRAKRILRPDRFPIVIINYDILGPWVKHLRKLKPQLIVVDECHYISNRGSKRYKNVKRLSKGVKHIIALSGTPLTNRPVEMYAILNLLRPDKFPSFFSYGMRYCNPTLKPWGWEYKGATNLIELNEICQQTCMIRRRKVDVLKDLPQKQRIVIPMALDRAGQKEYDHAVKDFLGWLKSQNPHKVHRAAKAQRLVQMGYLKRLAGRLKLPSVIEWVDNFLEETDEKLILFGIHKLVLGRLRERYHDISSFIDGSVTGRKRQLAIDRFNTGKKRRLMLGQLEAAGVGWSCPVASTVGFAEIGWKPGDHEQASDRVHGVGRGVEGVQSRAYYFVAKGTIEEYLCEINQKKQGDIHAVLDGSDELSELNLFDQLVEFLSGRKKL